LIISQFLILIITIFNLLATILMMCVIDRFGRRPLLLVGAAFMFIFMVAAGAIAVLIEEYKMHDYTGLALLACLCGYMVSFGIGWGGVCWVYPSEIFPMDVKERAISTSVFSQYFGNFVVVWVSGHLSKLLGYSGTFFFFGACNAVGFVLCHIMVKETKGKTLEEVGALFGAEPPEKLLPEDGTNLENGTSPEKVLA